jgi:protein required for attachment to host cells
MKRTWILVANSARACCFERGSIAGGVERLRSFECPESRAKAKDLETDRAGYEEMGHGRGSASFGHGSGRRAKVREQFARDLAEFLNAGIAQQRCAALVLMASPMFLGRIKAYLSEPATKMVAASIGRDLTGLDPAALARRLRVAVPRAVLQ